MPSAPIRIGTRGSALARRQASAIAELLRLAHPEHTFTLVEVSTVGDRDAATSLSRIGGQGVFVKEIERLAGRVGSPGRRCHRQHLHQCAPSFV